MDRWAEGRIALVTGATSGFGEAFARRFAAAGGRVIAAARREDRLRALAGELGALCLPKALDVTDPVAVARLPDELPEGFAAVDVLFNSAGLALGLGKAAEADLSDWDTMIATNVTGLAHVTRAILPGMVARNRGHILNLGSVAGSYPYPGGNAYGGTKAFVHQFSLNLRADLIGTAIRVTCIEPGMAHTEFSQVRFDGDKGKGDAVYAGMQPLTGDDIAQVAELAIRLPAHVNVNTMEVMPVAQAFSPFAVARG